MSGAVATLTIQREFAANSLTHAEVTQLSRQFEGLGGRPDIRVIVLQGEGARFFCAGHDLQEMRGGLAPDAAWSSSMLMSNLVQQMHAQPQMIVAKVSGVAAAGGLMLVAGSDLAIASETARFGTPGINIGLWCWGPMVALSRTVAPKHALSMLAEGQLVDAAHAQAIGLVNQVVPADDLDRATDELASRIASKSGYTLALGKRAFYRQLEMTEAQAHEYVSEAMARNAAHADPREGIQAFIDKRPANWTGRT